jgi:hypothetical protein
VLIAAGVDVEGLDRNEKTALALAGPTKHADMILLLRQNMPWEKKKMEKAEKKKKKDCSIM